MHTRWVLCMTQPTFFFVDCIYMRKKCLYSVPILFFSFTTFSISFTIALLNLIFQTILVKYRHENPGCR
jgi:hypothetical protein